MNDLNYDVAIPGNHEFDYGMERFLELTRKAVFLYISCNFNREGELVFAPYIIKEIDGVKLAFVGVTTPETIISSTPRFFQDEEGNYIYCFMPGDDGAELYGAVQKAVDDAKQLGNQTDHEHSTDDHGLLHGEREGKSFIDLQGLPHGFPCHGGLNQQLRKHAEEGHQQEVRGL